MRKNGFTLIELLAVIVILAIIALIATPIILGIINDARKESQERSVELYASAVRNGIAAYQLREMKEVAAGSYTSETLPFDVEYDGDVVCTTIELYEDGGVYVADCTVNDLEVEYTYGTQQFKTYKNGDVVYYDVTTGLGCSKATYESSYGTATVSAWSEDDWDYVDKEVTDYLNSVTGYNGVTKASNLQNGCMKFYAFNDDGGDTLNLILDHNTTAWTYWNSDYTTVNGPKEVTAQLKTDTSSWKGTLTPTNYSILQENVYNPDTDENITVNYTVDYSDYKARLITANEIAQITGNEGWDEATATSYYYFDSLTTTRKDTCKSGDTSGCQYGWLYDRTYTSCENYGCLNNSESSMYGYWTVSSYASFSSYAWYVYYNGYAGTNFVSNDGYVGVRPVITILKSQL